VRLLLLALLATALLALGACGDDSNDNQSNAEQSQKQKLPPGEDGSASGGDEGLGGQSTSPRSKEGTAQPKRKSLHPERQFRGVDRSNFQISRAVCGSQTPADAAQRYRAKSKRLQDIARAYANISYKVPQLRRAGYAGCLAGLRRQR
jgi:hypothetical protein